MNFSKRGFKTSWQWFLEKSERNSVGLPTPIVDVCVSTENMQSIDGINGLKKDLNTEAPALLITRELEKIEISILVYKKP